MLPNMRWKQMLNSETHSHLPSSTKANVQADRVFSQYET